MPQEALEHLIPPVLEGEDIYRRGSVVLIRQDEQALTMCVGTSPAHTVMLYADGTVACTCGATDSEGCAHIIAAGMKAVTDGTLRGLQQEREQTLGREMLLALSRALPGGESVRVSIALRLFDDGRVGLGLQMGQERLYAVRNIAELLACYTRGLTMEFSSRFTYRPASMRFSKDDEALLAMLMSYIPFKEDEADAPVKEMDAQSTLRLGGEGRFVLLSGAFLQSVLRFLETRSFLLMVSGERLPQPSVRVMELSLCFSVSLEGGVIFVRADGAEDLRLVSPDARYVLSGGHIVRLHGAQARVCRLLAAYGNNFRYDAEDAEDTLSTLLPALSTVGMVVPQAALGSRLRVDPLKTRVYIDLMDGNVEAKVELHYGELVLHPFEADVTGAKYRLEVTGDDGEISPGLLLRDGRAESELLDFFSDAGFVVREGRIVLRRAKDILTFCTQGVTELEKLAEVFVSDDFRKIKPRRLSGRAAFRMRGGRLVFTLLEDNEPIGELVPILQAVRAHQQYVRLKTGEFLDVRDMAALAPVAQELL
ncbi:MAG: SNF2 helicase associated domain-containing protein, partial [Eubacteriales bacterium]|nr:SNF2 helicase associated domain-containing protein [Eubacteriales bacterium]